MMNSAAAAAAAASSTRAYDYDGDHSHIAVATNADTAIETASTNNGDCVNVLQRPVDAVNSNTTHLDAEVKMNGAKAAEDRKRQEQAESDDSSIRGKKHFPRVRVLISNKEFEDVGLLPGFGLRFVVVDMMMMLGRFRTNVANYLLSSQFYFIILTSTVPDGCFRCIG